MKSVTRLLQRSFSSWATKLASLALIITVVLFSLAAGAEDDNDQGHGGRCAPQIEGSWLVTVTIPGGPPPFRAIETYSAGGGLLSTDGSTPPSAGHVYQGTWARTGRGEVAFTFLGLQYNSAGVHSGFIRVRETLILEPRGHGYDGAGTVEFLDLDQNVTFSANLTAHGTRINAE